MSKIILILVCIVFILPATGLTVLVGKVDIQKILVTTKEGAAVRKRLKKNFDGKQKILKKLEGKIKKMQEDYKKQSMVMNTKAKGKKELEIRDAYMEMRMKSEAFQKEIQKLEDKLKKPILSRVKEIVDSVSKNSKVDMTFEISTAPIVYAKSEKDLTAEVIKQYDKKYPLKK